MSRALLQTGSASSDYMQSMTFVFSLSAILMILTVHSGPSKVRGALSATLQLQPGTHHIKFLVKDDMVCSSYLPTTVDYTNILVNYIEVLPDKPVVSAVPSGHATTVPSKPLDITTKGTETASPARSQALYHQASPSSARASPTPQQKDQAKASRVASPATAAASRQPPKFYTSQIPSYLLDLDTWPPPDEHDRGSPDPSSATARFHRANAATSNLPAPPSLPLFLSKSILNGTTPMKDDNSVLIMPNHTVLNHLATTNIRGGVLATSATCRYKKKVSGSSQPPLVFRAGARRVLSSRCVKLGVLVLTAFF